MSLWQKYMSYHKSTSYYDLVMKIVILVIKIMTLIMRYDYKLSYIKCCVLYNSIIWNVVLSQNLIMINVIKLWINAKFNYKLK